MPKSRRDYDDDDDHRDDRPRRRRQRSRDHDQEKSFPLVWVLVLIFVPIFLVGGFFAVRAMRSSSSSTQESTEDIKSVRAKLLGHWVYDQGGGNRMQLTFLEDERVTWEISMPNGGRSITTNYETIDWGKDRITIRIHDDVLRGTAVELRIEVVSDQKLNIAVNSSPSRVFTKQATKPKNKKQ